MRAPRVLVVDDEPRYVRLIEINLEASGYSVLTATDGPEAVELAAQEDCDLILLDIGLPRMDGYAVCKEIRRFSDVPVIMLTARGQTSDIVQGLDAGADDYIPKPFSAQELLARIRARLRRSELEPREKKPVYQYGDVTLDTVRQRLFVKDKEVHLTPTEYHLLTELVAHAGRVLVTSYLLSEVWGSEDADPRLLWQAIHRLRGKIERDPTHPEHIQTRSGIGYIFLGEEP
ncbi:MAG: response regulator transcription factor [Anaerolineae bacterium]|nr:response regulator transcription factor [Anaerolineae bacterium]